MNCRLAAVLVNLIPAAASGQQITVAGRACHPLAPPKIEAIVDRKQIEPEIQTVVGDSANGQLLLSIVYGPNGAPLQVRALASDVDSALKEQVLTAVAAGLKDLPDGRIPGARVLLTLGHPFGLQAEPATYCPPTRPEPVAATREATIVTTQPPPSTIRIPAAKLIIGPDGRVERVELEGSSGLQEFDDARVRRLEQGKYLPAVVDGLPVRVQITER